MDLLLAKCKGFSCTNKLQTNFVLRPMNNERYHMQLNNEHRIAQALETPFAVRFSQLFDSHHLNH